MNSSSEKSVQLPTSNGAPKNFQMWWMRFVAYVMVYKFNEAISKDAPDLDLPLNEAEMLDESNDAHKKKIMAKKHNAVAMASLSMAFTSEGTMFLVYKAMNADWPNGLVHLVIKGLFKKYQPQDMVMLVELRQMLNKISMKKDSNLAILFEQIASVENRYSTVTRKIPEEELIAIVLDKSTKEYKTALMVEQRVKGTSLKLEDLESAMNQHWHQIGTSNKANEKSNEILLVAVNGIICFKCGKKGHKASMCPENNKGSAKEGSNKQGTRQKEKKKCYRCGKVRHIATNCWEDKKNTSKRLANWKSVNASGLNTYFVACVFHPTLNS